MKDQELVKALQSGSQEAFQIFYDRFFDSIYKFCFYRLGQNHNDTEDVVSEVLLTAIRKVDDLHAGEETKIFNWLAQIARFKLMEAYRRRKRQDQEKLFSSFDETLQDFLEANIPDQGDEDPLEEEESLEAVVGVVLTSLPDDYRLVLHEKYLQGRSVREISQIMGRSEKAVESLLTRARDTFRKAHKKMALEREVPGPGMT